MTRYVWGIDLSVNRFDVAFIHPNGTHTTAGCLVRHPGSHADRLTYMQSVARPFFEAMASHFPPERIAVELPTGKHLKPILMMAAGVCAMTARQATGCEVVFLSPGEWKKTSLGFGNASKSQILAWARARGYVGDAQDGADALGIATACAAGVWA